ncbi:MAG: tetratricopeptide repeat protein [Pseudomonadales bacterium]|jgi:putative thioredoxin
MSESLTPGGAATHIVDVTVQNFQELIEKSRETPVLLEFYAEGAEQSQSTAVMLNKLVNEYQGKFLLGRIDVQQNPQIAQQLGIRGLPTVKVIYQGQMVQDLEGPQEESSVREILDQITMSPVERIKSQIDLLLAEGRRSEAIGLLQQLIQEEPGNGAIQVELADLLIMDGRAAEARQILAALPADTDGISKPVNRLEFIDLGEEFADVATLTAEVEAHPDDLNKRYQLAVVLVVDDQVEAALEQLLLMLQKDKEFSDELARKTMIRVFDLLGKGDPVATAYRRKMFAFLH